MTSACASCLSRSHLVSHLGPRIAEVAQAPGRRVREVLALAEDDLIAAVAGTGADAARRFSSDFDPAPARRRLQRAGIEAVCAHEPSYPARLRELTDAPAVLYFTGSLDRLVDLAGGRAVCVVGARNASGYGLEVAYQLGRGLGAAGVTVVSGLALGIDASAHRGALDAGGPALAVLAGGPDVPYPRTNRALYERVRIDGVVASEMPPGQASFRWAFPARNRLMAALAAMTVVVEAADPSGSLITATFAEHLGREVGAVPGRVTARMAAGSNRLLRDGAIVIRGAEDVLDELFGPGAHAAGAGGDRAARPAGGRRATAPVEPELRRVLDGIEAGEGPEAIGRAAGIPAAQVRAALGQLELCGLVRRDGLGCYERTATP